MTTNLSSRDTVVDVSGRPFQRKSGSCSPDRDTQYAVLAFAHYKDDANDEDGKSVHGWIGLERLLQTLSSGELSVLDHYLQNNPNPEWDREVARLRAALGEEGGGEEAVEDEDS